LTVNGSLSATTLFGNGGNLTGISTQDTKITAFTYNNNNLLTITNSTGGTLSTLISQVSGLTVNGNINVTGTTNISGQTSFGGAIISGGTNLLNIFSLAGTSTTNTFTTGATFNSNLLTLTRNDNVQVNTLVNNFSALTVNGDIISNNTTRLSSIGVTGLTAIDSISTGTTNGVTWFYTIKSSTSLRAGTVVAGWIGASVVFTETTTTDIGNTDAVVISVTQSGGNIKFNVTPSSGTWSVNLNRMLI
jgi:YD repeat-containing protein